MSNKILKQRPADYVNNIPSNYEHLVKFLRTGTSVYNGKDSLENTPSWLIAAAKVSLVALGALVCVGSLVFVSLTIPVIGALPIALCGIVCADLALITGTFASLWLGCSIVEAGLRRDKSKENFIRKNLPGAEAFYSHFATFDFTKITGGQNLKNKILTDFSKFADKTLKDEIKDYLKSRKTLDDSQNYDYASILDKIFNYLDNSDPLVEKTFDNNPNPALKIVNGFKNKIHRYIEDFQSNDISENMFYKELKSKIIN